MIAKRVRAWRAAWRSAARTRIMAYALLASLACGATEFLGPVDEFVRSIRYLARDVPADGSIVVVGIDEESLAKLDRRSPWSQRTFARVIASLKAAGARKIIYDGAMAESDEPAAEAALIDVLKRYPNDIYFGTTFRRNVGGSVEGQLLPAEGLRPYVGLADYSVWTNPIGQVSRVPLETPAGTNRFPSISARLAGVVPKADTLFRPDYAIRAESFPYISAVDAVTNPHKVRMVEGKDVLIGPIARMLGDIKNLPGQGRIAGVYIHAIAAQTLKGNQPVDAGWGLPLAGVALFGAMLLFARRAALRYLAVSAVPLLLFGPILLDARHIAVDVAPALLFFTIVAVQHARLRLGWQKSRTNDMSGLANIIALREVASSPGQALVAAKIDSYSAIIASFTRDVERTIVGDIAARLRLVVGSSDIYQADDGVFYWLMPYRTVAELGEHLEGLRAIMGAPVNVGNRRVDIAMAFGVDTDTTRSMISRAGSALLCADEALRAGSRWKVYDAERSDDAAWQLSIASEMDRALEDQQFWLAFQPKLNLSTGKISGAEVLARWHHPERGDISPSEFIPAAERNGRIHALTDYMIGRALDAARLLRSLGTYKLAINVSVPILERPGFADSLLAQVRALGVDPGLIVLEVTESVLISASDAQIAATLEQLRRDGFGLSIDDFGTGYSTLDIVRRVPAHEMKVDQSFVRKVVMSQPDRVIVESIVDMAHHLNRSVVAEGVEDAATLEMLRTLGCDEVQGYFVGRPVPLSAFVAQLRNDRRVAA